MIQQFLCFLIRPGRTTDLAFPWPWVAGVGLLGARLWLAWPFASAGWHRLFSWDSQEFLFTSVHPVPLLPAFVAAPMTTGAEIVLSALLILGLCGRVGAAGLAVMAATLFLVIGQTPEGIENGIAVASEQIPWMIIGIGLFILGPGVISLDMWIQRLRRHSSR